MQLPRDVGEPLSRSTKVYCKEWSGLWTTYLKMEHPYPQAST